MNVKSKYCESNFIRMRGYVVSFLHPGLTWIKNRQIARSAVHEHLHDYAPAVDARRVRPWAGGTFSPAVTLRCVRALLLKL